jgi:uncharacterized membrane protein YdjX (TVP38/TMEM64 family)
MNRRIARRIALVAALLALAGGAFALGGPRHWVASLAEARALAAAHPLEAAGLYVAAYVAFAALALPGAWAVSVAGGALFGAWLGFALALAGSVLGATASMLTARYLLRDLVRARLPGFVAQVDAHVARQGARWVVAARLTPVMPFFAVNLAAGLTEMPAAVFAAASAVGSAPLAGLYAFAGARLERVQGLGDVLSPGRVAGLMALGLAVVAARPLARWRGWTAGPRPSPRKQGERAEF